MPDNIVKVCKFGLFVQRFLQVVFAEMALSEGVGTAHGGGRLCFTDRQKSRVVRRSSGVAQGICQAPACAVERVRKSIVCHAQHITVAGEEYGYY
ncbi:hypothetical protein GCM10022228_00540 [Halomonas cibimaris]|uniref:Secreted protein n=1 Tax=Halomonas cibimaris TaxID=657012 RepID=A0ABP7L1S2_9GAMM